MITYTLVIIIIAPEIAMLYLRLRKIMKALFLSRINMMLILKMKITFITTLLNQ